MPISPRQRRIGSSILIAVLMVAGAYVLPGVNLPETKEVNAELTDDLLASYVSKDTDQDGLPDWQESLYGTSKDDPDTDGDGVSDGEAVRRGMLTPNALSSQLPTATDTIQEDDFPNDPAAPGSITDQFARAFFEAYIKTSNGQPMSEEAQEALIARLVTDFSARAARVLTSSYTSVSIRRSAGSVSDYAFAVERTLKQNEVTEGAGNPVLLMQALIEKNDESARPKLKALAAAYRSIADELLVTPAPAELTDEHLVLVRSFDSLAKATLMVSEYEKDPLGVLGALAVYPAASKELVTGLEGVATAILNGGEPGEGAPGAYIVNFARYTPAP